MNVNFQLTDPASWAVKSLNSRSANILAPANSTWATQRTPWVRVISSAVVNGNTSLRNEYSLDSRKLDTFESSYNTTNNRPKFGVTQVTVDFKGTMGSTRSCVIEFQCWTLEDLNWLEQMYMVPGISVIVEWGWSIDNYGNAVTPDFEFDKTPVTNKHFMSWVMHRVFARREQFQGNYDGVVGLVTNFSYKMNEHQGYDCSFELISPGDMWLDQDPVTTSKNESINDNDKQKKLSNLEARFHYFYKLKYLDNLTNPNMKRLFDAENQLTSNRIAPIIVNQLWKTETREFDKQHETPSETVSRIADTISSGATGTSPTLCEVYIAWPKVVNILNANLNFFYDVKDGDKDPEMQYNMPKLGQRLIPITILPKMMSADPRVCTFDALNVDPKNGRDRKETLAIQEIYKSDTQPINDSESSISATFDASANKVGTVVSSLLNWVSNTADRLNVDPSISPSNPIMTTLDDIMTAGELVKHFGDSIDNDNFNNDPDKFHSEDHIGYFNNVYINAGYLRDTIDSLTGEHATLETFLTTILTDINNASGGIWDLTFHVDPSDETRLQIYDANYTSAKSRERTIVPYEFKISELLLRNADVETKLVEGYREMVLYGNNSADSDSTRGTAMRLFGGAVKDGFIPANVPATRPTNTEPDTSWVYAEDDLDAAYYTLLLGVDDESVSSAKNAIKAYIEYINRYRKDIAKYLPINQNILLPFNFSIDIDGFSGLIWGNAIAFDRLPPRYKNRVYFQTIKVKHSINPTDWITTVDTIMRIHNDDAGVDTSSTIQNTYQNTNTIRQNQLNAANAQSFSAGSTGTSATQTANVYQKNPKLKVTESPEEAAAKKKAAQDFFNKKKGKR